VIVIIGLLIGQAAAFGVSRVLGAFVSKLAEVMDTSTSDPILVIGAPVLLGLLTMIACYLPARRSMSIHPTTALRNE
jgi:ABC-type lipoprotein release transport system permease subunit